MGRRSTADIGLSGLALLGVEEKIAAHGRTIIAERNDGRYPADMRHPATPVESLFAGGVLSCFIVYGLVTGRVLLADGLRVRRDKEPIGFWIAIGAQVLLALTAIGYGVIGLLR